MKKILAIALLATIIIATIPSTYAAYDDVDILFQKTNYRTKTLPCKTEKNIKEVIRDIKVGELIDSVFRSDSNKANYLKQKAYDSKNLVDFTMLACDIAATKIIVSADNNAKKIDSVAKAVVVEANNTNSGGSFYSSTLGTNVGVISYSDLFSMGNSMSQYDYIVKKDVNGAKLYTKVQWADEISQSEWGAFSELKFKFTKWISLVNKKKGNYMKLGNSYYVTAQK